MSCVNSTSAEIVTGAGIPLKSLFGVNVISPVSGTIVYVPILLVVPCSNASTVVNSVTVFVLGSTNFAGCLAEAVTGSLADSTLNVGLPFCGRPCKFWLSALTGVAFTEVGTVTLGIYSPSIDCLTSLTTGVASVSLEIQSVVAPLVSCLRSVIPWASPTNPSSGVNSTFTSILLSATVNL